MALQCCKPHWSALRERIEGKGLGHLIARDGKEAVAMYREGARYCESVNDFVSRDLFTDVLSTEEHHVDMLETQFEMIARMGIQNYVQLQSEEAGE